MMFLAPVDFPVCVACQAQVETSDQKLCDNCEAWVPDFDSLPFTKATATNAPQKTQTLGGNGAQLQPQGTAFPNAFAQNNYGNNGNAQMYGQNNIMQGYGAGDDQQWNQMWADLEGYFPNQPASGGAASFKRPAAAATRAAAGSAPKMARTDDQSWNNWGTGAADDWNNTASWGINPSATANDWWSATASSTGAAAGTGGASSSTSNPFAGGATNDASWWNYLTQQGVASSADRDFRTGASAASSGTSSATAKQPVAPQGVLSMFQKSIDQMSTQIALMQKKVGMNKLPASSSTSTTATGGAATGMMLNTGAQNINKVPSAAATTSAPLPRPNATMNVQGGGKRDLDPAEAARYFSDLGRSKDAPKGLKKWLVPDGHYDLPAGRALGRLVDFRANFGFIRPHSHFHGLHTGKYPLQSSKDIFVLLTEVTRALRKFPAFKKECDQDFISRSDRRYLDINTIDSKQVTEFLAKNQDELCVLFTLEQSKRDGVQKKEMAVGLEFFWKDEYGCPAPGQGGGEAEAGSSSTAQGWKEQGNHLPANALAMPDKVIDPEHTYCGHVVTWHPSRDTGGFGYLRCEDLYQKLGCDVYCKFATIGPALLAHLSRVVAFNRMPHVPEAKQAEELAEAKMLLSKSSIRDHWNQLAGVYLEKKGIMCTFKIAQPRANVKPEAWNLALMG
ncbi:unnamed protein product [Amoebophrya sp. A120]|nr:unnamed protein product [Amoebophrya sp. A120]|eukprot:GSA120T00002534001.1